MSEKQKKSTELEHTQTKNASLEKPQNIKKQGGGNVKYANIIFINLCMLGVVIFIGWHFLGQHYTLAIEERLALIERTKAFTPSLSDSDIKKLQEEITLIHKKIDDINLKNTTLNSVEDAVKELKGYIQELKLRVGSLEEKETKTIALRGQDSWQEKIRQAIKSGMPLKDLQHEDKIPAEVRQLLSKLDTPVTYKEISEEWNKIRDLIRFQGAATSVIPVEGASWVSNIKAFFKSIFRVQRLDKNNLTYEETFLRYIDKMLIEKDIEGLLRGLTLYEGRLDQTSKEILLPWVQKIEKFREGQTILEAVKKY